MNFIVEIRNRFFCSLINWFYLINILYYYKETVLFLFLKQFVLKNTLNFYFICTNITELIVIYIQLIKFFSLQINLIFSSYQIFLFTVPALRKTEFFRIKYFLYFALISYFLTTLFIVKIFFPLFLNFLLKFQESFVYLELKPTEFFIIYKEIFIFCQLQSIIFLLLFYFFPVSTSLKKYRKVYYFLTLLFITLFFNFEGFFVGFLFFILFFELLVISIILNNKLA